MKKLILSFMFLAFIGCATCQPIISHKLLVSEDVCPIPQALSLVEIFPEDIGNENGTDLIKIATNVENIKLLVVLWENYYICVQDAIKKQKELIKKEEAK